MKNLKLNRSLLTCFASLALSVPALGQMSGAGNMAGNYSSSMGSMGTDIRDAGARNESDSSSRRQSDRQVKVSKSASGWDDRRAGEQKTERNVRKTDARAGSDARSSASDYNID